MSSTLQPVILCVDDEKVTLKVIERLLIGSGYKVLTAENGERALEVLQSTKPDLVLLDVMMPGMDGYEVCAKLRANEALSYIPVLFVTALGISFALYAAKGRAFSGSW
jgi:putative two-component system response regulator